VGGEREKKKKRGGGEGERREGRGRRRKGERGERERERERERGERERGEERENVIMIGLASDLVCCVSQAMVLPCQQQQFIKLIGHICCHFSTDIVPLSPAVCCNLYRYKYE